MCAWPHRPDGSVREVVRAGAGGVLDEHAAQRGEDGLAGEASLFALALGNEALSVGSRQRSIPPSKEKRAPPTKEQMTSILLG